MYCRIFNSTFDQAMVGDVTEQETCACIFSTRMGCLYPAVLLRALSVGYYLHCLSIPRRHRDMVNALFVSKGCLGFIAASAASETDELCRDT